MSTTTSALNLRPSPGTSQPPLAVIPKGSTVVTGRNQSGWRRAFYPAKGLAGWVSNQYLTNVQTVPFIDASFPHLGKWYHYGANGPKNFDCSGFCMYVQRDLNYPKTEADRTANAMMHQFRDGNWPGRKVTLEESQPGDLAFFGYSIGKGDHHASHVVFMLDKNWCIGANGGSASTNTDAEAKARNAKVRIDASNYRETSAYPHKFDRLEIWRPRYA